MKTLNHHNLSIARLLPRVQTSRSAFSSAFSSILVKPDATVETDGRQLLIVSSTNDDNEEDAPTFTPFLLPREVALDIAKGLPKAGKAWIPSLKQPSRKKKRDTRPAKKLSVNPIVNGKAVLEFGDGDISNTISVKQSGTFPKYEQVVPDKEKAVHSVAFNPALLGKVLIEMSSFTNCVMLRFYADNSAIRLDGKNHSAGQTMIGVVMPMGTVEEL